MMVEPKGTDWAQDVIDMMKAERKMSEKKRKALASRFADLGNYTDAARAVLRDYANA